MAPITLAGTVAQSIAEALCAIVLIQCIRPGCSCAIGTFSSNVDIKLGSPAFGTPDYMRATQMIGQMARFYGLPLRASNTCVSNWSNYENWHDRGAQLTVDRARNIWKKILAEFEPPPLDAAIAEELDVFVKRRKREGGAPTDF